MNFRGGRTPIKASFSFARSAAKSSAPIHQNRNACGPHQKSNAHQTVGKRPCGRFVFLCLVSASVCKRPQQGFPGASGVALASYRQVKRPPWALFARRAFFLALLHALRAFNHKNRPIPHVLRVFNHKNRLFPRVFRHQVQLFGSHGLNSFSKLLSSCKQLPDHFRHVTKKVCAISSWRRANVRLSI